MKIHRLRRLAIKPRLRPVGLRVIAFALEAVALTACDSGRSPTFPAANDAAAADASLASNAASTDTAADRAGSPPTDLATAVPDRAGATDRGPPPDAEPRDGTAPPADAGPPPADRPLLPDAPDPEAAAFQDRLFGAREVVAVSIELPPASQAALEADPHRDDWVPGHLVVDGVRRENVGFKLKGGRGSFRELGQKAAFKVDLDRFVGGQTLAGLRKLTFNNMIQDTTQMRERLTALAFERFGLPAGRVGYIEITVNGEAYGLYSHVETLDEVFLARVFGPADAGGNLYEGFDDLDLWIRDLDGFDQDAGEDEDRGDLRDLVMAVDAATPWTLDETLGRRMDLEQARRFFAAEVLTGHWDGYAQLRNNYYLYAHPSDGRFTFLPSGADQAWQRTNNAFTGPGRVFRTCVDWLPCRLLYAQVVEELAGALANENWSAEIDRLDALLAEPFSRDRKTPTRPEQRTADIATMRTYIAGHPQRILNTLTCLDPALDADLDGTLSCAGDCDDAAPSHYPGAYDTCGDEVDQDCSGFADDGQDCPLCREIAVPSTGTGFLVCHRPLRYTPAKLQCLAMGASIASIHSEEEQQAITAAAAAWRPTRWWIGLADAREEGTFAWLDGTPLDYQHWAPGQPDNGGGYEDCVALHAGDGGTWADYYSGYYQPFICRR